MAIVRWLGTGVAGGCALGLAGCAGPTIDHAVEPAPTTAVAPSTALAASKLTQGVPRTLVYDSSAAAQPLVVVQDEMPTCHCAGKTWWIRYYLGAPGGRPEREVRLVIDPSGYIAQAEEINHKERVEVVYTPALVLIPDQLPAQFQGNAAYTQTVKMVVHPLGDRTKVRMSGPAVSQIRYLGDERITTGAGEFTARHLTATLAADFSAARTVSSTEQWFADGVGLVCERSNEQTTMMGAKVRENAATILLKSIEGPAR